MVQENIHLWKRTFYLLPSYKFLVFCSPAPQVNQAKILICKGSMLNTGLATFVRSRRYRKILETQLLIVVNFYFKSLFG